MTQTQSSKRLVLIVPQSNPQEDAIQQLLPEAQKVHRAGGDAYLVGSYYSDAYAEMICGTYRALDLLTIVLMSEETDEVPSSRRGSDAAMPTEAGGT